jgi:IS1 family transposase
MRCEWSEGFIPLQYNSIAETVDGMDQFQYHRKVEMDVAGEYLPIVYKNWPNLASLGNRELNVDDIRHFDIGSTDALHLFASKVSAISRSFGQIVRVNAAVMHFPELAFQNQEGTDTNRNRYKSENGYPKRGIGSNPSRPVHGWLFLLLGCALIYLAFRIADEPNPPVITRLCYWYVGACGFLCIFHGVASVLGFSVTHKYHLTSHNYCNTLSAIGRAHIANVLSTDKQVAIISALAEGSGIRQVERITGVHRDTIMRLGVRVGQGCADLLDSKMRNLSCQHLQFDEVWGFIGKKQKHVEPADNPDCGDVWTFCAIDSDTKLVPSFKVGKRDSATANAFVGDVASRLKNRVQVSTDSLNAYVQAVEQAFGANVDYAQIVKVFDDQSMDAEVIGMKKTSFTGRPNMTLASTSHVERLNGTTRLHMCRLTRLTYAFSKKLDNFEAAVALHFAYYNFVKRHNTLRCTPAMAAGVERDFWTVGNLIEAAA